MLISSSIYFAVLYLINSKVQLDFQITDYNKKIQLYNEIGLNVSPQECKKTGFEEFKKYLKKEKQIIFNDTLRVPVNNNKPTIGVFDHSMISFELKNILEKTNV